MNLSSFSINAFFSVPESNHRWSLCISLSCALSLYYSVTVFQTLLVFCLFVFPWLWQFWRVVQSPSIGVWLSSLSHCCTGLWILRTNRWRWSALLHTVSGIKRLIPKCPTADALNLDRSMGRNGQRSCYFLYQAMAAFKVTCY